MPQKPKKGIGLKFAIQGIFFFFSDGRNPKIHLAAAIVVIITGFYIGLNAREWLWISLAIALVFIAEMINSAIELLCDLVMPIRHPKAGKLKDIAAGAVLIAALFALIVAGIVFGAHLL